MYALLMCKLGGNKSIINSAIYLQQTTYPTRRKQHPPIIIYFLLRLSDKGEKTIANWKLCLDKKKRRTWKMKILNYFEPKMLDMGVVLYSH